MRVTRLLVTVLLFYLEKELFTWLWYRIYLSRSQVLVLSLYWQVEKSQAGVFSITGALSFVGLNQVFTYAIG